ncbi:MAG: hypothetical protein WC205_06315 [Opitutaceae bacterium]|jgi:hypothetical protein
MKFPFCGGVLVVCLLLAGCESVRNDFTTGVREKFTGPSYIRRVVPGESASVFAAARASAEQLGFRITRSGPAQGVIDGVSGLASDDRLRGSRQRTVKVRLSPASEGGIEVAVLFTEVVEDDFTTGAGQGTESSLRNHPLYDAFFAGLGVVQTP